MSRKVKISRKEKIKQDSKWGTTWVDVNNKPIDPDHICKCWDMYCEKRMTARQLLDHFPGRTFNAIKSKVYSIRGRTERSIVKNYNQEELFRKQITDNGR